MRPPCPNCGNRSNSPVATKCHVCGNSLTALAMAPTRQNKVSLYPAFTDKQGRHYQISLGTDTYIGSRGCAITLQDPQIQPRHVRIFFETGAIWIEPFSGCMVMVNGNPLTSSQTLQTNDIITIGSIRLTYLPGSVPLPNNPSPKTSGSSQIPKAIQVVQPQPITNPNLGKFPQPDLEGDIRYIEGPYMEDPDPTLGRQLAKAAGFLLALWKPAFIMLNNHHRQVPVRYVRVEELGGQLRVVKMKGEIVTGMISTGDQVLFWGEWQGGTLLMFKGYNITAKTDVFLRQ
jgi:hypothetical protein